MFAMSCAGRGYARAVALLVVCAIGPVRIAFAQSVTGSIQGTIVDQSGAVLPGVTVNVTNSATGVARTVVSDATGTFRAELLPVGPYDLSAELPGFSPRKREYDDERADAERELRPAARNGRSTHHSTGAEADVLVQFL